MSTVVRARIDEETKAKAIEALAEMGLSVSDAIRILLTRVAEEKRLPFIVKVPNDETVAAMKELREGKGEKVTIEELEKELDI